MTQATAWYLVFKDGREFNHLEDGWATEDAPKPVSDLQRKAWKGHTWEFEHVTMADTTVFVQFPNHTLAITIPGVKRDAA